MPRALALLLLASSCDADPSAPHAGDPDAPVDDRPRCGGLDTPCDALPPRPDTLACGAVLRDDPSAPWPARLSELGCFAPGDPTRPTAGMVPYDVRAPLWSDGADKGRWLGVPPGTTVGFTPEGPWAFPDGAILLKLFALDEQPVEIRVMAKAAGEWRYASYAWEPTLGDGRWIDEHGELATIALPTREAPWYFPALIGCETCHRSLADEVLGPRTAQLDVERDYDGLVANQLVALYQAGVLDRPDPPGAHPTLDDPYDPRLSDARRARAWLHANCAHCHRPGGFVSPEVTLDLRATTPLADAGLCLAPSRSDLGPHGELLLVPGDVARSHLYARLTEDGPYRMPPDGGAVADGRGLLAVRRWIETLPGCP